MNMKNLIFERKAKRKKMNPFGHFMISCDVKEGSMKNEKDIVVGKNSVKLLQKVKKGMVTETDIFIGHSNSTSLQR